jgi:serine/threonine-protein kinase
MREDGDYALTRPNSRTPSRIINAAAAADLLKEFRTPATIVEAVIRYSRERKVDPERTLEEAFPMLESLAVSGLLAPSSSAKAKQILPSLEVPSRFMEFDVLRCLPSPPSATRCFRTYGQSWIRTGPFANVSR